MKEYVVVSCFDGIACAMQALKQSGIKVKKYYAIEIDQRAVKVAKKNHPEIIHYGDITRVKGEHFLSIPDFICGGSPCQGFSFAGKQLNFDDPRSKLFWEFVRLYRYFKALNPDLKFFLENVRMKKESQDVISEALGVQPIFVNSALVSAQNRQRLYWTNIEGFLMPEDRGIVLNDILDEATSDKQKSFCLDANYAKGASYEQYLKKSRRQMVCKVVGKIPNVNYRKAAEIYLGNHKSPTVISQSSTGNIIKVQTENDKYRILTPEECEKLQGLPVGYTDCLAKSGRYHGLGNGWQVDTIVEFFKHLPS